MCVCWLFFYIYSAMPIRHFPLISVVERALLPWANWHTAGYSGLWTSRLNKITMLFVVWCHSKYHVEHSASILLDSLFLVIFHPFKYLSSEPESFDFDVKRSHFPIRMNWSVDKSSFNHNLLGKFIAVAGVFKSWIDVFDARHHLAVRQFFHFEMRVNQSDELWICWTKFLHSNDVHLAYSSEIMLFK